MALSANLARARSLLRKKPSYVLERLLQEASRELERWRAPRRQRQFDNGHLLQLAGTTDVDELWMQLAGRPYPAITRSMDSAALDRLDEGESARILSQAELASRRVVDLLGTGPIELGIPVDWSRDYRANAIWPKQFARSIEYVNQDRPSDVKVPWEISRLQWLITVGQSYVLTGDERYAAFARDILEEWIAANPLAYSVNWAVAMEAAMRIFTWTCFFHMFARSNAWSDGGFRMRFLSTLYLHGDFALRHIEKADINGNHYTADLSGLVMAGLFFGGVGAAPRWLKIGWSGLIEELPRQVLSDGVDYEASCAYHRLVFELFLWPALYRKAAGQPVPEEYARRLCDMARFTVAYSRTDGSSPLWGDADDARALPLGGQSVNDHRYIVGLAALAFNDAALRSSFSGPCSELAWVFGPERADTLPAAAKTQPGSAQFAAGGVYIMRHRDSHVFIDCGPVGLAGRGGHGHNDALSFELWLDGVPLITDSGSYVYTASFDARNRYRATGAHNTPQVDRQEINRFDPENLWMLHDDANPVCEQWRVGPAEDFFAGRHGGYGRLGVEVRRTISFDKTKSMIEITDQVGGTGSHEVRVPFHLAPGVSVELIGPHIIAADAGGRIYNMTANAEDGWACEISPCAISPSYGVLKPSTRIVWARNGMLPATLNVRIEPRSLPA
jgi:uncharacterized heparinase superfamily protein